MLVAAGMREIITYNVVSEDSLQAVGEWREDSLSLANPMNEDLRYLRTTLRASMLQTVSENRRLVGEEGLRLFELGRIFLPNGSKTEDLPQEREMLTIAFCGWRHPHWWHGSDAGSDMDFFDAKGMLTSALGQLGLNPTWEQAEAGENLALHPGRTARIMCSGSQIGLLGELHPTVIERFDLRHRPATMFELYLDALLDLPARSGRNFRSLTRFPSAHRDVALVVPENVPAGKVQEILDRHRLVDRVELFDVYVGDNLEVGAKSLAFHVYFQSPDRTLTAEEVNRTLDGLRRALGRDVGATLRD